MVIISFPVYIQIIDAIRVILYSCGLSSKNLNPMKDIKFKEIQQ